MILRVENTTITPFKAVSRDQLPSHVLPHDSAWDDQVPWRLFYSGSSSTASSLQDLMLAKVSETYEDKKPINYFAALQRVSPNVYSIFKLDRRVRSKDMNGIPKLASKLSPASHSSITPFSIADNLISVEDIDWNEVNDQWAFDLANSIMNEPLDSDDDDNDVMPTPVDRPAGTAVATSNVTSDDPSFCSAAAAIGHPSSIPANAVSIDPENAINERYIETLYSHNTPLVLFAKSALRRVKDQCQSTEHFLQLLHKRISPITLLDQKYQDPYAVDSLDDCEQRAWQAWLDNNRPSSSTSNAQDFQDKLEKMKIRETKMQIILLLEMLANSSFPDKEASAKPAVKPIPTKKKGAALVRRKKVSKDQQEKQEQGQETSSGSKLTHDLSLDILFDRLCIHNAVVGAPANSNTDNTKASDKIDKVQEFCLEIVVPFFRTRLPDKTKEILKKAKGVSASSARSQGTTSTAAAARKAATESSADSSASLVAARRMSTIPIPEPDDFSSSIGEEPSSTVTIKQNSTVVQRGGILATTKDQQKRQVAISFGSKKTKSKAKSFQESTRSAGSEDVLKILRPARRLIQPRVDQQPKQVGPIFQVEATPQRKSANTNPTFQIEATPARNRNVIEATPSRKRISEFAPDPEIIPVTPKRPKQGFHVDSSSPLVVLSPEDRWQAHDNGNNNAFRTPTKH